MNTSTHDKDTETAAPTKLQRSPKEKEKLQRGPELLFLPTSPEIAAAGDRRQRKPPSRHGFGEAPSHGGFEWSRSRRSIPRSPIDRGRAPSFPAPGSALAVNNRRRRGMLELEPATQLPQNLQHALDPPSKRPADSPPDEPPAANSCTRDPHGKPHLHALVDGAGAKHHQDGEEHERTLFLTPPPET